jgi:hypothetical protein
MWKRESIELNNIPQVISQLQIMEKLKSFPINIRYIFTLKGVDVTYMLLPADLLILVQQSPNIEFTSFFKSQMIK